MGTEYTIMANKLIAFMRTDGNRVFARLTKKVLPCKQAHAAYAAAIDVTCGEVGAIFRLLGLVYVLALNTLFMAFLYILLFNVAFVQGILIRLVKLDVADNCEYVEIIENMENHQSEFSETSTRNLVLDNVELTNNTHSDYLEINEIEKHDSSEEDMNTVSRKMLDKKEEAVKISSVESARESVDILEKPYNINLEINEIGKNENFQNDKTSIREEVQEKEEKELKVEISKNPEDEKASLTEMIQDGKEDELEVDSSEEVENPKDELEYDKTEDESDKKTEASGNDMEQDLDKDVNEEDCDICLNASSTVTTVEKSISSAGEVAEKMASELEPSATID